MGNNRKRKPSRDAIPEDFGSPRAAAKFWDTHDLTDYEDLSEPVQFRVQADRQTMVLDPQTTRRLRGEARRRHVGMANLANSLLKQALAKSGK